MRDDFLQHCVVCKRQHRDWCAAATTGFVIQELLQHCVVRAQAKAAAEEAKYKARVQQRRDYMDRESGRNDGPFFALLFSFFVLPAAVILIVAWQTGYLASLDSNQHF